MILARKIRMNWNFLRLLLLLPWVQYVTSSKTLMKMILITSAFLRSSRSITSGISSITAAMTQWIPVIKSANSCKNQVMNAE